mmetsp:Transcript_10992/g.34994  ORF Transcript_10992/g.34994 Transcript_10992/m.34994 type:complete len:370 (+) Transcript_10992:93-1202(+)
MSQRWRGAFALLGKGVAGATAAVGGLCLGVGIYGSKQINMSRQRWFTDSFVLTPETLRLPYQKVSFETEDGVELDGWFIEQTVRGERSKNLALCCCPYNQDKSSLLGVARGLWDAGYSVLLFDFRSFAPKPTAQTIGYLERRDGRAALNWLSEHKPDGGKIGLVGASMGGAVALMLASENHPDVIACATDCAFSSLKDVVGVRLDKMFPTTRLFGLDSFLPLHLAFVESICLVTKFWYGYDPARVGPREHLSDIKIPLLVVHSELDSVVPVAHGAQIFTGSGTPLGNKEFFVAKDTEHIGSYFKDEKEYSRRIVRFFEQVFTPSKSDLFVAGHKLPLDKTSKDTESNGQPGLMQGSDASAANAAAAASA